jgi:hypothetical protein
MKLNMFWGNAPLIIRSLKQSKTALAASGFYTAISKYIKNIYKNIKYI